ncbi:M48 family metallopeptidase [Alkalicaulis satelles]|uniref:M48 family metallopeptidase n=1 Tax=Alkalicaulis satelles TaxID=2609175 RepID=A0A5M6ZLN5_9PROT|nr:M48 family metallopeptidase [Alkalicaulis satelles]KAA5804845.1 M48 family metallopeptidase [Alkalicaulis satelles]
MIAAAGLRTHIWNNNLKSIALMAGFPVLLLALTYAGALLIIAYSVDAPSSAEFLLAWDWTVAAIPWAIGAAAIWFVIAWLGYQKMIDAATGAREVTRTAEPRLYNLLENLCISRGITMPSLRIIETQALNAYASGLSDRQAAVTVTRGLMDSLNDEELEAVLAHELTHIRNRDVRLLVISVIFVGIISFLGQIFARGMLRGSLMRAGGARRGGGGNAGALILVALAIVALAYVLALVIRFAMSRKREFMADAGAVELTRNPDAMISALRKISGRSAIDDAPEEVRQMFLDNDTASFAGLFTTHPPIPRRIAALQAYAGGSA